MPLPLPLTLLSQSSNECC